MSARALKATRRAAAAALFVFCAGCAHAPQEAGARFMVAAAHPLAAEAGHAVLERGGSAVDAAVAVQMVLGLVEPQSSGLGGGAFMLHWSEKEKTLRSYDGREAAPAAATAELFLDRQRQPMDFQEAVLGGRSVGVPGVLRLLELAHRRHGRLPWAQLLQQAIAAAEEGFPMSPQLHAALERERFLQEDARARHLYYDVAGRPKAVGTRLVNPAYGATLRQLAEQGAGAFYRGPLAAEVASAVRGHAKPGGLSEADLAGYKAVEREPLCGPFRAWVICSMAPPSAGGIGVLQILGLAERAGLRHRPPQSEGALHLFAEAGRLAYADRARHVGDPDFVPVPAQRLVDPSYLDERARRIGERAMRLAPAGDPEAAGTTHFTIADAEGNVVSMTSTIESRFGSRIMVAGFLLNNELTDFDFAPGTPNAPAAGKRPRSSMAPAIVFGRDGAVRLAVGSPGGPFIINYVAKALLGALAWELDLQAAVALPNFGNRNGATEIERGSAYERHAAALRARGHEVVLLEMRSGLHGIERHRGGWRGAVDPRGGGAAKGG